MHEALISYSTKDKNWADSACSVLEARGIRCWIAPRDIVPGTKWGAAIIAGIDACKIMVLIFSASANESPQVRREVERAISKGLPVVPCRVENVKPAGALEFALGNTQWLDVFTPPVERQMKRLADSVRTLLPRDGDASSDASGSALAADSTGRTEGLGERYISRWSWRGKYALVAAAGLTSFVLFAASLTVVFWPRKDSASVPERAALMPQPVPARQTPSSKKSPRAKGIEQNVKPVATPVPDVHRRDGFLPLFNGKDLAGWHVVGSKATRWSVNQEGVLAGSGFGEHGSSAFLVTDRDDFANFDLRVETKLAQGRGFSDISFRVGPGQGNANGWEGYGVWIEPTENARRLKANTGSLCRTQNRLNPQVLVVAEKVPLQPKQWFVLEVIARGPHLEVLVEGKKVAEFDETATGPTAGSIKLICRPPGTVEFRTVEIKELSEKVGSATRKQRDSEL